MQPLVEQAIQIANEHQGAGYGLVFENSLGEILKDTLQPDPAKGIECVYLVTAADLPRPIYIGSTIKGLLRFKDHLATYGQSQFGQVVSALGADCYPWMVSYIHSDVHRWGGFRRDETRLIIHFQPYIYGMAWGPYHHEKPEFIKRYEATLSATPTPRPPCSTLAASAPISVRPNWPTRLISLV